MLEVSQAKPSALTVCRAPWGSQCMALLLVPQQFNASARGEELEYLYAPADNLDLLRQIVNR